MKISSQIPQINNSAVAAVESSKRLRNYLIDSREAISSRVQHLISRQDDARSAARADALGDAYIQRLLRGAKTDRAVDEVIKYHLNSLLTPGAGESTVETLTQIEGRFSFRQLMRFADVSRLSRDVILPVGDLAGLSRIEKEKLSSYLRLIVNRIQAMSTLPVNDVDEIADSLLVLPRVIRDFSHTSSPYAESLSGSYDDAINVINAQPEVRAALIDFVRGELASHERRARERFISQTIMAPLYRDVLLAREEFSRVSGAQLIEMAVTYARWLRVFRRGALHSSLREEISRTITSFTALSGLAGLQSATLAGVKQNAAYALATLIPVLDPREGDGQQNVSGYGVDVVTDAQQSTLEDADDNDGLGRGERVTISTPFATIERAACLRDVFGDPVGIRERYVFSLPEDSDKDVMIGMIRLLAELSGIQLVQAIDIDFISRFPQWAGVLGQVDMSDQGSESRSILLSDAHADRIEFDFMCAVLNAENADSTLLALFSEANRADLSKVADDGLRFFALAHKIVTRYAQSVLAAAKQSFEWHDSNIWKELQALQLLTDADVATTLPLRLERHIKFAAPALSMDDGRLTATRYACAPEVASLSPRTATMMAHLRNLGVVGDMTLHVNFSKNFIRGGRCLVDVLRHSADYELAHDVVTTLFTKAKRWSYSDLQALAMQDGRDIEISSTNFNDMDLTDPKDPRQVYLISEIAPFVDVEFPQVPDVEQIPVRFLDLPTDDGDKVPDAEDRELLLESEGMNLFEIDPDPFISVGSRSAALGAWSRTLALPKDLIDLRTNLRTWTHELMSPSLSSDSSDGY